MRPWPWAIRWAAAGQEERKPPKETTQGNYSRHSKGSQPWGQEQAEVQAAHAGVRSWERGGGLRHRCPAPALRQERRQHPSVPYAAVLVLAAFVLGVFHQRTPSVLEAGIVMTFEAPSSGRFHQMLLCLTMIPGTVPDSKCAEGREHLSSGFRKKMQRPKKPAQDARIGSRVIPVPLTLEISEIGKATW